MTGNELPTHSRSCFRVERDGQLLVLTLTRPEKLNALGKEDHLRLSAFFDEFERDITARVAIVTGEGRAFSAGNDLAQRLEGNDTGIPATGFAGLSTRMNRTKPVIAAVNGLALGGGFEIALGCDLIIAADGAQFSLPEPRVGVAALAGGLQMLARTIPLKQAMAIALTGRPVSAADGLRMGFINEVVALEDLLPAARRWAAAILECAPLGIAASMQAIQLAQGVPADEALRAQDESEAVRIMQHSNDRYEGFQAFREKRRPKWTGT